jgi:hypothetical protein
MKKLTLTLLALLALAPLAEAQACLIDQASSFVARIKRQSHCTHRRASRP